MSFPSHRRPWVTASVVALLGAAFLAGGLWLAALGGSWYYALAGAGMIASGTLMARKRREGLWVYAAIWLGTLAWALAETGLDFWVLEPKLVAPTVLGAWIFAPWVTRGLDGAGPRPPLWAPAAGALLVAAVGVVAWMQPVGIKGEWSGRTFGGAGGGQVADADWRFYGRTAGGDRFSPLEQITLRNVGALKPAWTLRTGDLKRRGEDQGGIDAGHEFNFEATPIKVGDTLYLCTGHSWVEAVDAATGRLKWKVDPRADTRPDVYLACRGVAYYEAPPGTRTPCPRRIISPVLDARLMAVNADTGALCSDFGRGGYVSLLTHLGHVPSGFHFVTSPPLVMGERVILGGWIYDNQAEGEPSGAVRAFNPLSGEIEWAWDLGRPEGRQNFKPGPNDELTRGTPNAWGVYTADPKLNLVYLPLGNATPDYYGGRRRPFDDKYSSSTVALDITTGAPRWSFQTTHHDVWDMDLPVGPSMVDLPDGRGGMVPALVQTNKRGEFFVLDRRDGRPLAEVTERRVPTNGVPGERPSPTQPYSTGMPSVAPEDLRESKLWGATPLDQMVCRIQFRQAAYQGQFTLPQLKKTIVYPAFDGVMDWNGAAIDPERKLMVAMANYIPFVIQEIPRDRLGPGAVPPWNGRGDEPKIKPGYAPQYGTPYVGSVHPWLNPLRIPCAPPPWGVLTGIDLVTRKVVWRRPFGTTRDSGPFGTHTNLPLPTGIFNIGGGGLMTRSGLYFVGGTADQFLRAVDVRTGRVVWRARLPAGGQANPVTYAVGGKQYVVIAAGGHSGLGTRSGDYVLAYALP